MTPLGLQADNVEGLNPFARTPQELEAHRRALEAPWAPQRVSHGFSAPLLRADQFAMHVNNFLGLGDLADVRPEYLATLEPGHNEVPYLAVPASQEEADATAARDRAAAPALAAARAAALTAGFAWMTRRQGQP